MNKGEYQTLMYKNRIRKSPHGVVIELIANLFKNFSISPEQVILKYKPSGKRILDLGCGDGALCIKFADLFNEVFGTDISDYRIKLAKKRTNNNKKFTFLAADMDSRLPFRNNFFDVITIIATFQYSYNPYFTLLEIKRVLKNEGSVFIQVTNLAWFVYRLQLLFGKQIFTSLAYKQLWDGGVLHYFTYDSILQMLENEGFEIQKVTCSGIFRKLKLVYPKLLASDILIYAKKK